MKKDTVLFWLFFIFLFIVNANIFGFIFNHFIQLNSATNLLSIFLLIVVVVPFTAILSDKLKNYALSKGLKETKNFTIFITSIITIVVLTVSISTFNHFREKDLNEAIRYTSIDFGHLGFTTDLQNIPENRGYEWVVDQRKPVEELLGFLSQYRVKVQDKDNVTGLHSFNFIIGHNITNPSIVSVVNGEDIRIGQKVYKVVNGPINMEWIHNFNQKYREKYGE